MSTYPLSWQEALSDLITDPNELWQILELDPARLEEAHQAAKQFPLRVPRSLVMRIPKNNPDHPLLKQMLPLGIELQITPGYDVDPLQEKTSNPIPGLLHKYQGRVLVTLTSACAIHCRYCFRRHFPYEDNNPGRLGWEKIFDYLRADSSIHEVILSGGDPLTVSDKLLMLFTDQLQKIPHIKRLRIHTRVPIVLPQRITTALLDWIQQLPLKVVIVVHANHPDEIDAAVKEALLTLRQVDVTLLNQAVLLKGVNDDVQTLTLLSETLFAAGTLPYYLHVLDKVQGAAHFDMPLAEAKRLHHQLSGKLPGYLVPRLACEEPGAIAKTLISME